jgi:hypothetical protein
MAAIGNNISSELAAQFQLLSSINNDSDLEPAEKKAKLQQETSKTLAMIEKEKDSLSIVNLNFVNNIQSLIQGAMATDDWDGIPPPNEMKREIADLQQVRQALAFSLSQGSNDKNVVLKLLMDINAKYGQAKAKEWLLHIKNSMESAQEQFNQTEQSIASQKTADCASAIGQIVGGSLSCAISAGSMVGSFVNAKKQLSALKDQKDLHLMKDNMDSLGNKSKEASKNVSVEKAKFESMKSNNSLTDAEIDAQDIKFASHEALSLDAEKNFTAAKNSYRDAKHAAGKINIKNQEFAAYMNSLGGFGGAVNSIANGAAGLDAAEHRAKASEFKLKADREEFQKNFDQNMGQISLDSFQKTGQIIDKHIQAFQNMEQSQAGMISAANRA